MPGINWLLNLQAKFDSLTGASRAVEHIDRVTQQAQSTAGRWASATEQSAARAAQSVVESGNAIGAETQKTQAALDRISPEKLQDLSRATSQARAPFDALSAAVGHMETETQRTERTFAQYTAATEAGAARMAQSMATAGDSFSATFGKMQADFAKVRGIDASGAMAEFIEGLHAAGYAIDENASKMDAYAAVATQSFDELIRAGVLVKQGNQEVAQSEDQVERAETKRAGVIRRLIGSIREARRETTEWNRAQQEGSESAERHAGALSRLGGAFTQMKNPLDGVISKLTKMALSFFTVRKLLRYLVNAISRAPDEIGSSLTALKTTVSDSFARVVVSALAGLQKSLDRLKEALESPGGQRFLRGLETAARMAGEAIGYVISAVAVAVEWIGNNFQQAATIAAVVLAFFGAKALFAAAATLAASWPVILLISLMAALVIGLNAAGVTSEQIFNGIGQAAGWLYATVYNLIADAWNVIAVFAEFFANVWDDPLSAVAHLFVDVFDSILGVVETAANAIDALLGSNMASAVSGFRGKLQSWVDAKFGEKRIKIERMEKLDTGTTMQTWGAKAESLATDFSIPSLDMQTPQSIKTSDDIGSIKGDTGAIRKSVSMAEEDLKSLVDLAERRFVAQFNLQHLAPQITINGANTGDTEADTASIVEAIKQMLIEQTASGSYISTAIP